MPRRELLWLAICCKTLALEVILRFTRLSAFVSLSLLLISTFTHAQTVTLTEVVTDLVRPIAVTNAGDGSGRLFITLQEGKVMIYNGNQLLPDPFLDITPLVFCCGERGLLSVAFHPNYESNGFFYVFYTAVTTGDLTIARYQVSGTNQNDADESTRVEIISIPHPNFGNHNGGQLQFGPDGMLYASTGDGGSGGDPNDNAQNTNVLLGKILRFNVDIASPYIPSDNPFVGSPGRDEIWAFGLRNPWRYSFDSLTGDMYIGDVGQGCYEEVSFQPANSNGGENYGWDELEGLKCYDEAGGGSECNLPPTCNLNNKVMPIITYAHADNPAFNAVTGGYVYRGTQSPFLAGKYIYADYGSGFIWAATKSGQSWSVQQLIDSSYLIASFGEGEDGEIYLTHNSSVAGALVHLSVAPDLPYSDDFSDNDASNWTIQKGSWTVVNGNLEGTTNRKATIISPFTGCGSCSIQTDLQINNAGGRVSLLGWYQSKSQLVELILFDDANKIVLKQRSGGRIAAKQKFATDIQNGVNYHIQIDYDGSQFLVFLNGGTTPIITLTSQANSVGTVGFRVKSTTRTNITGSFQGINVN
jgi:glucose/arabinose dehydrogenase